MVLERQRSTLNSISISKIFYLMFWLLKPFYIGASGSLQIGDMFILLSFVFVIFDRNVKAKFEKIDRNLYVFFAFVFFINSIYFMIYRNTDFIKAIFYYLFNFLGVFIGRIYFSDDGFLKLFDKVLKFNLLVQLAVYFIGAGRWMGNTTRYMGTYNDPNQLAFAVLTTYCLIYCLSRKINAKYRFAYFTIAFFLILQTSSTGMFMGLAFLVVSEIYFKLSTIEKKSIKVLYSFFLIIITAMVILLAVYLVFFGDELEFDSNIFQRIQAKLNKGDNVVDGLIEDRNLTGFFEYPENILYGSGEAQHERFRRTDGELHSTWLGLLFYYGVIPFGFLISWIKGNLKNVDKYIIPVYISIFVEALTLINHRQPSFWALIVLGSFIVNKKRD